VITDVKVNKYRKFGQNDAKALGFEDAYNDRALDLI
jgi:hypothetical protein